MKKLLTIIAMTFLLAIVYFSCAPKEIPATMPEIVPEGKATETKSPSGEPWQQEWESTLALARKEGKVTLFTTIGPGPRITIGKTFKGKFGIDLEMIPGRPPELVEKILAERRAGLFTADVYMTGPTTAWGFLRPIGALESPEKYLLIPEVMDPKVWWGGQLLWMDKERTFLQFFLGPTGNNWRNTELVRPEEITSYKDLLAPKWKGKILLADPLIGASPGLNLFYMAEHAMGWDYILELAKQEPVILRDERQIVEWVARGKYPIGSGSGQTEFALELQRMGLPLDVILYKEGSYLSQGNGAFTVLKGAPHPNATRVFINWTLTREGQTVFSRADTRQSARLDVPTDHLASWQIRQPGVNYVNTSTEESHNKRLQTREPLARILGIIK